MKQVHLPSESGEKIIILNIDRVQEYEAKKIPGSITNLTIPFFSNNCFGKNQAAIDGVCEDVVYCDDEQYELEDKESTLPPLSLSYILKASNYDECCGTGEAHIKGNKTFCQKIYDWNCYEVPMSKKLNCFAKDTPEGSGLPIHSTIYNHNCEGSPARPEVKYLEISNGERICKSAPLCENTDYKDSKFYFGFYVTLDTLLCFFIISH